MSGETSKKAILRTFAYRDVFSYPLTFYQLYCYLISEKPAKFEDFKKDLAGLLKEKTVKFNHNLFHLGLSDVLVRDEREKRSFELMSGAYKTAGVFKFIPWVKLVCVTGAVAAGNAPKNDDIDILIVTARGRLWLTRFIVVIVLKILNLYRSDRDESGKICPNLFMEEGSLMWGMGINAYVAHEILLMRPVFDRGNYYFRFLSENSWISDFLPNVKFEKVTTAPYQEHNPGTLEKIFMRFQLWYMRGKKTREITTDKIIHFKRDDNSLWVLKKFEKRCKSLGL